MTNRRLEIIRWISFCICVGIIALLLWKPGLGTGGVGALLFLGFSLFGLPAAMISLHLRGQKWSRRKS
jgi:hypothetical protein